MFGSRTNRIWARKADNGWQTVYDSTDGAIVIFGSAGSEIKNNRVISRTRMIMGGESKRSSGRAAY